MTTPRCRYAAVYACMPGAFPCDFVLALVVCARVYMLPIVVDPTSCTTSPTYISKTDVSKKDVTAKKKVSKTAVR